MTREANDRMFQIMLWLIGIISTIGLALSAWTSQNIVDVRERLARMEERISFMDVRIQRIEKRLDSDTVGAEPFMFGDVALVYQNGTSSVSEDADRFLALAGCEGTESSLLPSN